MNNKYNFALIVYLGNLIHFYYYTDHNNKAWNELFVLNRKISLKHTVIST